MSGGAMEFLLILNDSPYGTQRTYNALRLAGALAKSEAREVFFFKFVATVFQFALCLLCNNVSNGARSRMRCIGSSFSPLH
jgi:hypothetical protein